MRVFEVDFRKVEPIGDIPAGFDVAAFSAGSWVHACHLCRNVFGAEHAAKVEVLSVCERTDAGGLALKFSRILRAVNGRPDHAGF